MTDPYLNKLAWQHARGEISGDKARELSRSYVLGRRVPENVTMQKTPFRSWDDYFIPGTFVFRSKFTGPDKPFGESDPAKLRMLEEQLTRL